MVKVPWKSADRSPVLTVERRALLAAQAIGEVTLATLRVIERLYSCHPCVSVAAIWDRQIVTTHAQKNTLFYNENTVCLIR